MMSDPHQQLLDRAQAAYVGLAIGDALGATVEFMTPNEIKQVHREHKNLTGGGWLKLKAGSVTDDTEMSLALGIALLTTGQVNAKSIAEAFSAWMRGKPVDIGNTVRRGIVHYRTHGETIVPKSEFNAGNGACMRTLPIALATYGCDRETIINASRIQSHITHHSDISDVGTEHVIDLIHMALNGNSISEMETYSRAFTRLHTKYRFDEKREQNPSGYIVHTLRAVLQALYYTCDFESCLIDVVNRGGDADTTGAIAGMIAGALYGMDAIPQRWLYRLDNKVFELCSTQAEQLINIAPISIDPIHVQNVPQNEALVAAGDTQ